MTNPTKMIFTAISTISGVENVPAVDSSCSSRCSRTVSRCSTVPEDDETGLLAVERVVVGEVTEGVLVGELTEGEVVAGVVVAPAELPGIPGVGGGGGRAIARKGNSIMSTINSTATSVNLFFIRGK